MIETEMTRLKHKKLSVVYFMEITAKGNEVTLTLMVLMKFRKKIEED